MQTYELRHRPGLDALTLADRASRALEPKEVRLRVRAASLNYRDLFLLKMAEAGDLKRPVVPLSDGAGKIIEVGAAVSRFKVGARAVASCCPAWIMGPLSEAQMANGLGGGLNGVLAEEIILDEEALTELPEYLSFEEGATLPCAGVTAWNALFEAGNVKPGDTVLLQGTGGVSIYALQLATTAGASVILTSSSAEKRERALKMGATHVIDYVSNPDWSKQVLALTNGRGVDLAIDVGGPGTFDQTVASLRYEGQMLLVGALTGFGGEVNTLAIITKGVRITGVYIGPRVMLESLHRGLSAAGIHPVVDSVYGFAEAREAYNRLASGQHFGKVIIRIP